MASGSHVEVAVAVNLFYKNGSNVEGDLEDDSDSGDDDKDDDGDDGDDNDNDDNNDDGGGGGYHIGEPRGSRRGREPL